MSKILAKSRLTGGSLVDAAITHISSDGSSHTFINQNVTTNATPTFEGLCINNVISTDLIDSKTIGSNVAVNTVLDMQLNRIVNIGTPLIATDVASKNYVDSVARGLDWKDSVKVASNIAAVLTTDFQNGNTVDFITIVTGDRILIKDQSAGIENGIYLVEASGTPTRASDFAVGSNVAGAAVTVEQGTTGGDTTFICTNDTGSDIVGTDALVFTALGGGVTFTAGDGVQLVSSVLSIDKSTNSGLTFTAGQLEANVSSGLEIVNDAIRIAESAAGDGLIGGGGSALSINVSSGLELVSDSIRIAASAAGDGLIGGGGSALSINVSSGLELVSDSIRIASSAAGNGLTGGGGSALAINISPNSGLQIVTDQLSANTGTGLEVVNDAIRIASSAAGDGLIGGGGSALSINVSSGLELVSDSIRIASSAAGNGLTGGGGSALSVNLTANTYFVTTITELSTAITDITTNGFPAKVLVAPGTYTLTSALTIPDNVTIEGSGVEVTTLAVSTNISILTLGSNITLKNLQFEGNNTTADAITSSSETDILITHCRFTNKNANAISFTSVNRAQITNCQFESTATNENSTLLTLCNHVVISHSTFLTCSRGSAPLSTVRFDTCTFCTISDCTLESCDAIEVSAGNNINISNNILESPVTTDAAINVGGSSPNFTSVIGNQINTSAGIAISMASSSSCRGLKVIGNTIDTPTGIGIELVSGASSTDFECVVQGNTIRNNGAGGGISFTETNANAISAVVSGNQISNTTNDNFAIPSTNQKSRIIDNNAELSVTSTQTINEYTTHVIADTSGGAVTATIPNLGSSSAGFKLTIELETAGNDLTVTPTSFRDGTSVVMDTATQILTLEWAGEEWFICDSSSNFATLRVRSGVHFVENVTDLNAAITEVASGGKIILGPGSFTITSTITVPSNVTIEGSGIDVTTIVTGVASIIFSSSGNEVAIKNLTINRGTFTATAINFSGDQCLVENCRFTGSGTASGTSIATTGLYNKITLCVFDGVPATTLVFNDTGSIGTIVTDNSFVITGTSGTAMFSHGTHIRFANNYLSGGLVGCHYSSASEHNSIIGNTFLSIDTRCVRLIGTTYVNITGNSFRNASLQQIEMTTTARYINISSNTFRSATADAIGIESSSTDISIADNAFSACAIGIDYDGTTATIVGNTFNGCTTEAIGVGTSGCVIKDNVFDSNTQAIDIAASVNDCIITGNRVTGTATQISVNATGNDRVQIKDNNYSLSVSTASPTIEPYITHLVVDTSSNTVGATIPDLTPASSGARLYIELETAGNNLTVTPTNFANGTSVILDTVGDFITLQWDGRNWHLITNSTTANVQPTLTITPSTLTNADTVNVQNPALLRQANECTLSTVFNITPNLSATVTSFEFGLPNRTTVTNNYDISALATGWFDSSGIPESIENLFVRADTANNGAFCKFTSSANAETVLTHYVSVLVRYNADS